MLMVELDDHFVMGGSHLVCEDYTLTGTDGLRSWYVVCDGCSSSTKTDVGARVLAHVVGENISRIHGNCTDRQSVIVDCGRKALDILETMGLGRWQLMCTLHIGIIDEDETLILSIGDGFDWVEFNDGSLFVATRAYKRNAPFYVGYLLNERDHAGYLAMEDENGVRNSGGKCVETHWRNGVQEHVIEHEDPTFIIEYAFPTKDVAKFGSATDGVDSFSTPSKQYAAGHSIVPHLGSIANPSRGFMKRRLNKMLIDLKKQDLTPFDDVGAATICVVYHEVPGAESGDSVPDGSELSC